MASKLELVRRRGSMRERLIVALDVDNLEQAKDLVRLLAPEVGMFKIGKQLFTHAGPQAVRLTQDLGGEIFLDLKFHDIPNTVAKAAIEATRLGVRMFNVHASGSLEMMRPTEANRDDQQRVMTPHDAVRAGVDYIVVGRPILESKDPVKAARAIVAEMEDGGK